jgi:murein DD-endopeptidase MepM/ murein hydrolase activator NlpD
LIKAGVGRFFASAGFAILTFNFAAVAQSPSVQTPKDQTEHPQSAVQIVTADQKPLTPKLESTSQTTPQPATPAETVVRVVEQAAVTPPAPAIIKKTTNSILIPASGVADSKFEERPAVSSSVSVGSVFGYRRDPFTGRAKFHSGTDIKARWGDAVGASQAGIVVFAGWYHGYGNMIVVNHGGGVATHYAHLSSFDVEVGTHVQRGTIIGRAGSTGRATSPHLHYELRIDGNAIDPFQPLALDPSSAYFKQARPTVEAGRAETAGTASAARSN